MVHTCVVAGCRNRRTPGTGLSFYRFPRDPERKQRWIAAVNRQGWAPNDGSRLCSTHFISGKQVKNPRSPDYVPSVFTPLSLDMKEPNPPEVPDKQEARVEAANALLFLQCQGGSEPEEASPVKANVEGSGLLLTDDDDEESLSDDKDETFSQTSIVNFDDVFKALRRENRALRESVEKMSLSENCLRNDAEKVKFYTGLPNFFVLETVMLLLSPHMDAIRNAKLSKFQQLLLTLMRLRLDLRNQDLAYRFGVKVGTVVRTVNHVINIMSSTLVPTAVFWPSRAELRKNLPAALHSSCPDCAVIVDCFAVPCEGPVIKDNERGAAAAACNVLNYLIGVAPQGVVTFVSRGVLGNFSPRNLAQGSGFLCKLLPGDVVLASRDLDISDAVAARGARFDIAGCPEDGSSQRAEGSPPETLDVQAHVERVVSMVRQRYTMLTGPVERAFTTTAERTSNLSTFDKIVQVACALNNLCISAAPLE
ncbi:uncharacterized protein LOC133512624 isoform X1 [Syngnathoides biaculeatus]|uniref:uncharacterized protein LOC133512624 isoform X1 n=1 Tax=Syngnathoides biaculeatus TaxID=300417 RepID=UPI002ADE1A14|nr:uncharacterized protein LOC133512624 isoform X1 [Syngnathoides biaculeatus]